MLFRRQQLLLSLLDAFGAPVGQTDFQKLLFLYTQECETEHSYEFVPYRFGGFSFTSYADKRKLIGQGLLVDDDQSWQLTPEGRAMARKKAVDTVRIMSFARKYNTLRGNDLIAELYRRYPYYASRSEILDKLTLDAATLGRISDARPRKLVAGLLTIGYEGRSLEGYLNELLRAGVSVLCDIRRNPLSRKYGFSKGTLSKACAGVGIRYEHLPELGIASDERQELVTQADYDALFAAYEATTLPGQSLALETILGWAAKGDRVALTCYEKMPAQCHRHCVAKALIKRSRATKVVQHL